MFRVEGILLLLGKYGWLKEKVGFFDNIVLILFEYIIKNERVFDLNYFCYIIFKISISFFLNRVYNVYIKFY